MSRLYLYCALCRRKQAEGLISGAAWARLELPHEARVTVAYRGSVLRACPTCVARYPDWRERVLASFGLGPNGAGPRSGP